MAELRSCEKEVAELQSVYSALRTSAGYHHQRLANELPELTVALLIETETSPRTSSTEDAQNVVAEQSSSSVELLAELERVRTKLGDSDLAPRMEKFRKRLEEKDPVTDKPRYGEKTIKRVQHMLLAYQELVNGISIAFEEEKANGVVASDGVAASPPVIHEIRSKAREEEAQVTEAARLQAIQDEEERQRQQEIVRQQQEQARQAAQSARLEEQRREAEQDRLAQVERLAQRRAQEAADRADAEWMSGIAKGPDGVREQLQRIRQVTESDLVARSVAFDALHQLFSQIVAHPEEVKFRRVRRDHERFNADIGRHDGGKEVLIAAGFVLGKIDEQPSFISKEPNIEKDMDGWAKWFDLLKATLQIIEEELIKG